MTMSQAIEPMTFSNHHNTLRLSQQAPSFLSTPPPASNFFPLSLFTASETPESWTEFERLFIACLATIDDKSAHLCLERLTERFGSSNERVIGLRGLFQEAVARDTSENEKILEEYEKILSDNPMNVPIIKRRVTLLCSLRRPQDAIEALVGFLRNNPTDAEAWCELSDLYLSQGMSSQASFCLEEALLIVPNAWNLHARLGEVQYIAACSSSGGAEETGTLLKDSIRHFCRSIELCDDYMRGYYGLKIASHKFLEQPATAKHTNGDALPSEQVQKLNDFATAALQRLIQSRSDEGPQVWNEAELIAAQALLDRYRNL